MAGVSHKRAMELLAESIGEIVGTRSEAYRDLLRAVESASPVDIMLAESAFEALDGNLRRQIATRVEELVKQYNE